MLRVVFNVNWRDHLTNDLLYQGIPKVSEKVTSRRLQLAGHCFRHPELTTSSYGNPNTADEGEEDLQ